MEKLHDAFSPELDYSIEEAKGEVDGKSILAKVKGEFFFPGGISRNQRYYSKGLWEKTLANEDLKEKVGNRTLFGTISHDQPIDDKAMLDGKISHIVTSLSVDGKGKGIGEALLLDTDAGRILNTFFRAGSKMFVSSRADGDFTGETYKGVPIVDEDSYCLHSFDFVLDPGFKSATPQLKEAMNEDFQADFKRVFGLYLSEAIEDKEGDDDDPPKKTPTKQPQKPPAKKEAIMSEALLESLTQEKLTLQGQLADALKANEGHIATIGGMEEKAKGKNTEIEDLKKTVTDTGETQGQLNTLLAELNDLGSPEEIQGTFKQMREYLAEIKDKAGTPEEALELLDMANEVFGDGDDKYGSVDEIRQAYSMMRDFIEKMKHLGTPEEIQETLEFSQYQAELTRDSLVEAHSIKLAEELGVTVDIVAPMVEKGLSDEEIKVAFKTLSESANVRHKYTAPAGGDKEKNDGGSNFMNKSFGDRLLENTQGTLKS